MPSQANTNWTRAALTQIQGVGYDLGNSMHQGVANNLDSGLWTRIDAASFLSGTTEARIFATVNACRWILRRDPSAGELPYFVSALTHGTTLQQVFGILLATDEFFFIQGHGTPSRWLNAVYTVILSHTADQVARDYWIPQVGPGYQPARQRVADQIVLSEEACRIEADVLYFRLLGHSADAGALAYWAPTLQRTPEQTVIAWICASEEFFYRAQIPPAPTVNPDGDAV